MFTEKSASGVQKIGGVPHRGFAANDPAWHRGCEENSDRTTSENRYYHLDHLGTPDTLTDKKGNIAWSVSY
ncbi:RHS domain-containing protein, partial [Marinibactrum halimedae]|uniref:RHS domain-containing protein n=1 Tax=Marinibactrum halimedae TaxID=1444977 RepID=UPI001E2F08C4